ncbi:MAG: hypothetical protein CM1200mP1_13860 [Candidatus Neomarinimicrobiota bacterium]|nr:MAG: hypothetical protein CM1200mP1_13860 [Candidatus Neomarinimicrobiota bacterium]
MDFYSSNWADGVHAVDVGGIKFNEKNRSKMKYNPFLAMAGKETQESSKARRNG